MSILSTLKILAILPLLGRTWGQGTYMAAENIIIKNFYLYLCPQKREDKPEKFKLQILAKFPLRPGNCTMF